MTKDTANALFAALEAETFPLEDESADPEKWIDENTPPTVELPRFQVRLDAQILNTGDREFRLRVLLGDMAPSNESLVLVAHHAEDHGVITVIQNSGIELSS